MIEKEIREKINICRYQIQENSRAIKDKIQQKFNQNIENFLNGITKSVYENFDYLKEIQGKLASLMQNPIGFMRIFDSDFAKECLNFGEEWFPAVHSQHFEVIRNFFSLLYLLLRRRF